MNTRNSVGLVQIPMIYNLTFDDKEKDWWYDIIFCQKNANIQQISSTIWKLKTVSQSLTSLRGSGYLVSG